MNPLRTAYSPEQIFHYVQMLPNLREGQKTRKSNCVEMSSSTVHLSEERAQLFHIYRVLQWKPNSFGQNVVFESNLKRVQVDKKEKKTLQWHLFFMVWTDDLKGGDNFSTEPISDNDDIYKIFLPAYPLQGGRKSNPYCARLLI